VIIFGTQPSDKKSVLSAMLNLCNKLECLALVRNYFYLAKAVGLLVTFMLEVQVKRYILALSALKQTLHHSCSQSYKHLTTVSYDCNQIR